MSSNQSVSAILAKSKDVLANANKFQSSVTGGNTDLAAKPDNEKKAAESTTRSHYSYPHQERKGQGEFMGIRSNQAGELNSALKSREQAREALKQE